MPLSLSYSLRRGLNDVLPMFFFQVNLGSGVRLRRWQQHPGPPLVLVIEQKENTGACE